jgi:hypothetical protein
MVNKGPVCASYQLSSIDSARAMPRTALANGLRLGHLVAPTYDKAAGGCLP